MTKAKRTKVTGEKFNPYDAITDRIIAKLEAGVVPWRKEWNVPASQRALGNSPRNARSNRPYRGINFAILYGEYSDPRWLTFKEAKDFGGTVRKGEHGTQIAFWKPSRYEKVNDNGEVEVKNGMILRLYTVFNVEQCDDLKLPERKGEIIPDFSPSDAAEKIVSGECFASQSFHGSPLVSLISSVPGSDSGRQDARDARSRFDLGAVSCVRRASAQQAVGVSGAARTGRKLAADTDRIARATFVRAQIVGVLVAVEAAHQEAVGFQLTERNADCIFLREGLAGLTVEGVRIRSGDRG